MNLPVNYMAPGDLAQVHAHAIFLSSLGGAAERLQASLPPGRGSICLEAAELPSAFRNAFSASVLRDGV